MNIIIFNRSIGGHHLEYIHHIYMAAINDLDNSYYFVLPQSYQLVKDNLKWPSSPNIKIELFKIKSDNYSTGTFWKILRNSWTNSILLSHYVKKFRADVVYCNVIMEILPLVPLFLRKIKLLGIIYKIYLYEIESRSSLALLFDKLIYRIMGNSNIFWKIFILNDKNSADRLNAFYHTNKFVPLPDPFIPISKEKLTDFRVEHRIPTEKKLFVQFGTLCENKSTVEILESIKLLDAKEKSMFSFAFAGKVYDDIKVQFYNLVHELQGEVQIIVIDKYCAYETFASMCMASDAILTPYRRTAQSSGLIGYASQFHKPVIAPNKGLLGDLIKSYSLGLLIEENTPERLADAYRKVARGDVKIPDGSYCEQNNVDEFQKIILGSIK